MNRLGEVRQSIYDAIKHVFAVPVNGFQYVGRVDRTSPAQPVLPQVWIDSSTGLLVDGIWVATFPIVVAHDGTDQAQIDGIEEILARVIDAASRVGSPQGWDPRPVDVGGPSLRSQTLLVDVAVDVVTFCPEPAFTAS